MKPPITRRAAAVIFFVGFAGLLPLNARAQAPASSAPPNVLLIIVDDLNTDIGCMDGGGITPHIDQLAREGVLFTNAHCNSPVCNPSRSSFLTGMLLPNIGVRNNKSFFRDMPGNKNVITLPRHFRDHGYQAIGAGKVFHSGWKHNPSHPAFKLLDREQSWNEYARFPIGAPTPKPPLNNWQQNEVKTPYSRKFWWAQSDAPDDEFGDFQNARYAAEVLRKPRDRPFFLACGILRPHLPFVVPRKYFERYPLKDIDWPAGVKADDHKDLPAYGKRITRRTGLTPAILKNQRWKHAIQAYRASTSFADEAVGVILDALKQGPHRDNTIVVLISDHGFHLGEKNHWTKFTFWDRSTRVPMIIAGPGIAPGSSPRTVSLVDLFPTLNELCNLPQIDRHDGRSFAHRLDNPTAEHESIARVFHGKRNHEAIIDENFRYIRYYNGGEELYDRKSDPHDWYNLAKNPAYADHIEHYRNLRFFGDAGATDKPIR